MRYLLLALVLVGCQQHLAMLDFHSGPFIIIQDAEDANAHRYSVLSISGNWITLAGPIETDITPEPSARPSTAK
jgi:hypothetical protein